MATQIPAIDADGHIMEHQDEVRPYLDDRWKGRGTNLWPGGQPWDPDLRGQLVVEHAQRVWRVREESSPDTKQKTKVFQI